MGKNNDDWQDVPLEAAEDDWQDVPVERPRVKNTALESGVRGVGQGLSMGWIDEMSAGLGAARDSTEAALGLRGDIDFKDAYGTYIDKMRDLDHNAKADNPASYTTGQVGGGIASAFVPGLGSASIAKAATLGGVTGGGTSEANPFHDPEQTVQFAEDVGAGALIGGVTQGIANKAAPVIGNLAKKVPDKLKSAAERLAFKASAGNQGRAYDEAVRQGSVNKIGRDLLDDGVVSFGANARGIAKKAGEAKDALGGQFDELFKQVDDTATEAVEGSAIANRIREYAEKIKSPGNQSVVDKVLAQADEFEQMGQIPLREAQRIKNTYKYDARDPNAMPIGKEATNFIKQAIGGEMDGTVARFSKGVSEEVPVEQFGEVLKTGSGTSFQRQAPGGSVIREAEAAPAGALNSDETAKLYANLKSKYATMAPTVKNATSLANRQEKNRVFSLTDYIVGGAAGTASLNPAAGVAVAGANKVLRERGTSSAAVGLDKIGDVLNSTPQAFGRFAPALKQAADRGGHSLGVTHFLLLQQDPEYRRQIGIDDE